MGTLVIGTIVDQARRTLLELGVGESTSPDDRWDRELELLPIANAVQRLICVHRPSAYVKTVSHMLTNGIQQTLPDDGQALRAVEFNLGIDGATVGRAVVMRDRAQMTSVNTAWTTATGSQVEFCLIDKENPKVWYPYPRPPGTWYVQLSYFAIPAEIASANMDDPNNGKIAVDDVYTTAIHDGIVGYALLKNSGSGDQPKSQIFLGMLTSSVGISYEKLMQTMSSEAA
ncbi:MAG: hypothetical protein C4521_07530 [Actinobacteria bacterium]|nr:MAG: hypothetical protein C4521_07530 [Actinomycetota bacterium]